MVDFQNLLIQIKRQHWGRGVQLKGTRFVNIKSIARKPKQDTQKVTKLVLVPKQKMYVNKWNDERAAKTSSQKMYDLFVSVVFVLAYNILISYRVRQKF